MLTIAENDTEPKEEKHDTTRGSLWHQNYDIKCDELSPEKNFAEEYNEVFAGQGCIPGEHRIEVDVSVTSVITPCRKVAFKVRDKLKQETL